MNVEVFDTADEAAAALAHRVADAIAAKPDLRLGLPAGRTPVPAYRHLVRLHGTGAIDFSRVRTFNLDEFVGLPPDRPGSFRHAMETHLFGQVNLDRAHVEFLDGMAADLDAECARYDAALDRAGGLDLLLLGIGVNGHIGFNEPAPALQARTHRVILHEETRRQNAAAFGERPERVPPEALSMGMATLLTARAIVLLATGPQKAAVVAGALTGPLTTRLPASLLQTHRAVDVLLDRAAAAQL